MEKRKLILNSNSAFSIYNFRLGLMKRLREEGYQVFAVAPEDSYVERIRKEGFEFLPVKNLDRKGKNPIKDFMLFLEYLKIFKSVKPDLVLNYTIKPNIYGSVACGLLGIPSVSVITGLGYVFVRESILTKLVKFLYSIAFRFNSFVVFMNPDDLKELEDIVEKGKVRIILSEGINTGYFSPEVCKSFDKPERKIFTFLFIGRFLKDKGVFELVEAGRMLKEEGFDFEIWLLGSIDKGNPASLSEEELKRLEGLDFVKVFNFAEDVRPYICACDCVVLPSYREGVPRILLEAMAMEKPLVASDAPGCREVCFDGVNGFLVKPKNAESLKDVLKRMLLLEEKERERLGKNGRRIVLERFDEKLIVSAYVELIKEVLKKDKLPSP